MSEHEHSVPSGGPSAPTEAELMDQMRQQLAAVTAADLVTELAAHLVNMATVRLGLPPERHAEFMDLDQARLLVDALAGLLEGTKGRLGRAEPPLRDGLAQLRLAWVELAGQAARPGGEGVGEATQADQEEASGLTRPPSGLWVPGMD
jgi:Domain of unknown function (DUF1844)